ncbi:MAG: FeoA family protein [Chloroflexota bacterium]
MTDRKRVRAVVFGWLRGRRERASNGDLVTLAVMRPGQRGVVADVRGGHRMVERLAALGVRPGKRITKVSSMLLGGPVTIEVDRAQVAIGHRTATRILIDVSVR